MDFPIVGSKIKVVVESSVTYQNLSAEKYKTNGKRISLNPTYLVRGTSQKPSKNSIFANMVFLDGLDGSSPSRLPIGKSFQFFFILKDVIKSISDCITTTWVDFQMLVWNSDQKQDLKQSFRLCLCIA